jgi:hypothetical protein
VCPRSFFLAALRESLVALAGRRHFSLGAPDEFTRPLVIFFALALDLGLGGFAFGLNSFDRIAG